MPALDGTGKIVELAPGYRISAPGLLGNAVIHTGRTMGTENRGPERATEVFDQVLQEVGVNNIMTIELDVRTAPTITTERPIRTTQGEDGLILDIPDLGAEVGQVVLAIDEDGIATWNFPVNEKGRIETPKVRGSGGYKRFVIRRHVPVTPPPSESTKRGLLQVIGRKVLMVLVYPVADATLGPISKALVRKWETKKRPYLIRWFRPNNYQQANVPDLDTNDWNNLSEGRSLLFIHGTTSTCHTGFANFPISTLNELHQGYGGRIFAFNHFTLSEGPKENASWFVKQVPGGLHLNLDLICHSRGGLVARALIDAINAQIPQRVSISRVVFVGCPNNGTVLANPKHLNDFVDRYTSILNLAPLGPISTIADTLETIVIIVKVIGHAVLNGLPGLSVMNPKNKSIHTLGNSGIGTETIYYGITSDFEPKGGLKDLIKDQIVDKIFKEEANDLLVPTAGVYKGSRSYGFPISSNRILQFPSDRGVAHSHYFSQTETSDKLKEWLL